MSNELIMPFLNDTVDFTLGFEIGLIWQKFTNGDDLKDYLVHTENLEQIEVMCETFGHAILIIRGDEWSTITTHPVRFDELMKSV